MDNKEYRDNAIEFESKLADSIIRDNLEAYYLNQSIQEILKGRSNG